MEKESRALPSFVQVVAAAAAAATAEAPPVAAASVSLFPSGAEVPTPCSFALPLRAVT